MDAKKKEMVWRGTATGIVGEEPDQPDQEKQQKDIDEVVSKMLSEFPPEK